MHTLRWAPPSFRLRGLVRAYAQRETSQDTYVVEPIPARVEQTLEFQFQDHFDAFYSDGRIDRTSDVTVLGAQVERPVKILLQGKIESFGIFFQPTGLSRLFGTPPQIIANHAYSASCVMGRQISRLWMQLAESPSFEARVAIAEAFLAQRAASGLMGNPMMAVADRFLQVHGAVSMSEIARNVGLGVRQFERRFLQQVGVTPKKFARVARFQTALDTKIACPQRSWLQIAHALEYHDQMHMVRDFQSLAGESPGQIISYIGDARPPAFLSAHAAEEGAACIPTAAASVAEKLSFFEGVHNHLPEGEERKNPGSPFRRSFNDGENIPRPAY